MGCLHDGHLSLVKKSKKLKYFTVVTIFINPTQFNSEKDLKKYPSQEKADITILKENKADLIFVPKVKDIYPKNFSTYLNENLYSNILCAVSRKNHFTGVLTIVMKLFSIINPDVAFFGEKDYQQLIIIKKMIKDLNLSINIKSGKTVRDSYGLALSSRNRLLSEKKLIVARSIYTILRQANVFKGKGVKSLKKYIKRELIKNGINIIEYIEIREDNNLQEIKKMNTNIKARIFVAVKIGRVRLIDNMRLNFNQHKV